MKTTPVYKLPYIEGTDYARDIPSQTQLMAETLEAVVSSGKLKGEKGDRGLPGVNAVENDAAVAAYITDTNTDTAAAVAAAVAAYGPGIYDVSKPPFNAVPSTTVDQGPAIQAALDAANAAGGGTVLIPPGTYRLDTSLYPYSNTHIMADGATVARYLVGYMIIPGGRSASPTAYNGAHDVTISGLTIDGRCHVSGVNNSASVPMSHTNRVTFDRCTFANFGAHAIDCSGNTNTTVRNCRFLGSSIPKTPSEAIQVDIATQAGFPAHGAWDGTQTTNLTVTGSYFGPNPTTGLSAPQRAIGSHTSRHGSQYSGITIRDCEFDGCPQWAITARNWPNLVIDGCKFNTNHAGGSVIYVMPTPVGSVNSNGDVMDESQDVAGTTITNCDITGAGSHGIQIVGLDSGRLRTTRIIGNRINLIGGDSNSGIQATNVIDLVIQGNTIQGPAANGIYLYSGGGQGVTISNNLISQCGGNAVSIANSSQVAILGTTTRVIGTNGGDAAHIRLEGATSNVTVTGTVTGGLGQARFGYRATSNVSRVSRSGNNWAGATTAISDSASNSTASAELTS